MTPAEHAALSAELARALGWKTVAFRVDEAVDVCIENSCKLNGSYMWRRLDYRDPTVCLPLIEWLALQLVVVEPNRNLRLAKQQYWTAWWYESDSGNVRRWVATAYELSECVARAVIAVKGKS